MLEDTGAVRGFVPLAAVACLKDEKRWCLIPSASTVRMHADPCSFGGGAWELIRAPRSKLCSRQAPVHLQLPDEHVHYSGRAPWLRAGVLGANDGLVSVASLMLGVEGGSNELHSVVLAGVAGLVAGALSMAVGEFVSVSSQRWPPCSHPCPAVPCTSAADSRAFRQLCAIPLLLAVPLHGAISLQSL